MLPLCHVHGKRPQNTTAVHQPTLAINNYFLFYNSSCDAFCLQYSPATLTAWVLYCTFVVVLMAALKIINLNLHGMYDRAQILSDPKASSGGVSHKTAVGYVVCYCS